MASFCYFENFLFKGVEIYMVNAELQHNPYLLETEAKFNGQEPKINSQIEKFENKLLADWVRDVPRMFYDEMNGYDFDLFFSGTEYDFQKLQQTFISLGVTPDQVRLIMRNELEDAEIKSNEIRELIEWLRENRNRQFDFDDFYDANKSLLEETFSCIVIRGKDEVPKDLTFSLENVKSVDEIAGTNLTYVPVVFVIEAETIQLFRNDLLALLGRKDVEQNQLFFCISPIMDKEYVVRFISDLGIEEPQIISRIDDGNVATYIKNYPMVAYVGEVIRVFEDKVNTLDDYLKAKNEQSLIENAEVYEQISELDDVIEKIKASDMCFVDLDNYSEGNRFDDLKIELEEMIRKWKSRKTKVVGDVEIDRNSTEYEQELARYLGEFYRKAIEHFGFEKERIEREFSEIYLRQPLDSEYKPEGLEVIIPDNVEVNGIKSVAETMKESSKVLLQRVGNSCLPAAAVVFAVDSADAVIDFATGEIEGGELAYELGDSAVSVAGGFAGGAAGAKVGAAIGTVVAPGVGTVVGAAAGGVVGGVVGTVVASEAYVTAAELGTEGAEYLAEKAETLAKDTVELVKENIPEKVDEVRDAFNDFAKNCNLSFSV